MPTMEKELARSFAVGRVYLDGHTISVAPFINPKLPVGEGSNFNRYVVTEFYNYKDCELAYRKIYGAIIKGKEIVCNVFVDGSVVLLWGA